MSDPNSIESELMGEAPAPGLLSEKDIATAKARARKKLDDQLRAAEMARIEEEETFRLLREEGKRTGIADKDEIVNITIDLPEFAPNLLINMEPYWHGYTYSVPRHVADSLREMMQRLWGHQQEVIEGKSREQQLRSPHPVALSATTGQRVPVPQGLTA